MNIPSEIQTTRTFFLISAIVNIFIFLGWGGTALFTGIVTCGFGCFMGLIPVINVIGCVMDFIAYNKLNSLKQSGTYGTVQFAAIIQIVTILTGNIVSMIFGIITLQNLGKDNMKNFFQEKGIY
ncbi:MAG: hypothetical protein ISS16_10395 [Ignavibacteria bacterium]|nr:hypothetical protein [Ignavibacteria bacterium]